jgi:hypothetical protein
MSEELQKHEVPAIYGAITGVMDDVRSITKGGRMSGPGMSYTFRKADDVVNALGDAFRDHGVMVQSRVTSLETDDYEIVAPGKNGGPDKINHWHRTMVTMSYQFTSLVDGSTVVAQAIGEGLDNGDKSAPKAMTGALKSAFTQAFTIAFENMSDPDDERPDMSGDGETEAQRVLRERREAQAKAVGPAEPAKLADDSATVAAAKAAAERANQAEATRMAKADMQAQMQRDAEHQYGPGAPDPTGADADPDADPTEAAVETLKTELGARVIDGAQERDRQAEEALNHASRALAEMRASGSEWPSCSKLDIDNMTKALGAANAAAQLIPADRDKVNKIVIHADKLGLLTKLHGENSFGAQVFAIRGTIKP